MKIYDCFLFFQEFDILELRLAYLNKYVDKFIILESKQEHNGCIKGFNLERELNTRFKQYKNKIIYFKNDIIINSYDDLSNLQKDEIIHEITHLIKDQTHFNKNILRYLNDTFQREMLRYPIYKFCLDEDKIIISDVDEIPNINFIKDLKKLNKNQILIHKHHEFKYFINYFSHSNWIGGTIASNWKNLQSHSFNSLRQNAKKNNIKNSIISNYYGYHFTFFGGEELIRKKLNAYAHQEFNSKIIKANISKLISNKFDIFMRSNENTININFKNNDLLDSQIKELISMNKRFFHQNENKQISFFLKLIINLQITWNRVKNKIFNTIL